MDGRGAVWTLSDTAKKNVGRYTKTNTYKQNRWPCLLKKRGGTTAGRVACERHDVGIWIRDEYFVDRQGADDGQLESRAETDV